ncbi:heavy metal-associated isoprenylated plant protein 36-like [Pyrus communis]|uniref:heavy metal-associated isoprenylated plant protein 36-like n=1 Tax=Pyrus communis TaxID=23211 RepID=UPI0035C198F3
MAKAEAKREAKPEKPKEIEEVSVPTLKYKIWVLKVPIHCGGCKKKVAKILKKIDGVYKTEFDGSFGKENKVTVTGNVEPEILIRKLAKGGKHAELWLDQKANNSNSSNDKKKKKGKNKERQQGENAKGSQDGNHGGPGCGGSGDNERKPVKAEVVQVQDNGGKKKNEGGGGGAGGSKSGEGANAVKVIEGGGAQAKKGGGGGGKGKEVKVEGVKQGKAVNMSGQPDAADKCFGGDDDDDDSDCEVEKSGGGGGGRDGAGGSGTKKKKKGQKGNANAGDSDEDEQCGDAAPARTGLPPNHGNVPRGPPVPYMFNGFNEPRMPPYGTQGPNFAPAPAPAPANHMAPHQLLYEYQYPRQNSNGRPIQAMNFNTAYPASSYGASQYAAPPPHAHSYSYVSQSVAAETEPRSYHSDSYPQYNPSRPVYNPPQQSDSFELFSDENPNGCTIM